MLYQIHYDIKHLNCGQWIVFSTEFTDDEPGIVKILFEGLGKTQARKLRAVLRKASYNGKRQARVQLARQLGAK